MGGERVEINVQLLPSRAHTRNELSVRKKKKKKKKKRKEQQKGEKKPLRQNGLPSKKRERERDGHWHQRKLTTEQLG